MLLSVRELREHIEVKDDDEYLSNFVTYCANIGALASYIAFIVSMSLHILC